MRSLWPQMRNARWLVQTRQLLCRAPCVQPAGYRWAQLHCTASPTALKARPFSTAASEAKDYGCLRCGATSSSFSFFCAKCDAVMPANFEGISYFELLGLNARFSVVVNEVDDAYRALQRRLHPDRHAQESDEIRELVEQHAARVNEAASTLRSPLKRASYWMTLQGERVLEEDQRIGDAATMMEVMEISEEIDDAQTQADIDGVLKQLADKIAAVEGKLDEVFSQKDWNTARGLVERLQMLTRLQERSNDWTPK